MRIRTLIASLLVLLWLPAPGVTHRANNGHPGVSMQVTSVALLGNGHVRASGLATCSVGEDWGVGFHIYEAERDRRQGMASLSNPVLPVICDGTARAWEAESADVYAGGVVTPGEKNWGGKMQSPSVGPDVHKDAGNNGTVTATSEQGFLHRVL